VRDAIDQTAAPDLVAFAAGDPVATSTEGVALREGPGLAFPARLTLAAAEPLIVEAGPESSDGLTWYEVRGSSLKGWTAADYLVAITSPGEVSYAIGGMTGPMPDGESDTQVRRSGARYGTGATVEVIDADLNLRAQPGGDILDTLPAGAWLVVTGAPVPHDGAAWFPVDAGDGRKGWVSSDYLKPAE
jgi:uncharacterized protein YraI